MDQPIALFTGTDLTELARNQRGLLCAMFDDPRLERLRGRQLDHPAVRQHDLLLDQPGATVRWPEELAPLRALSSVGLDFSTWAPAPPFQDFWGFLDEETRRWTVAMLEDRNRYQDVMAELFAWGWLNEQGVPARRVNLEGRTDLLVGPEEEWPCEVKRIHQGSKPKRIREVLAKANRQIKKTAPDGSGSVFVSIERPELRVALDDRVPNDVAPFLEEADRALHPGQLRSVAQLIVGWDDLMMIGEPPGKVVYAFRRRSKVLRHPAPRATARYTAEEVEFGRTMVTAVQYQDRRGGGGTPTLDGIESGDILVSQLFRQENEFPDGVRANHAIEVISEPDDTALLGHGDVRILLATRDVQQGRRPYVLLVIAVQAFGEKTQVVAGYRLYRQQLELDLSRNALKAFQVFLDRYGLDISIPGHATRFIPHCVLPPGVGLSISDDNDAYALMALAMRRADGATEFACAFGVDAGRYRAALGRKES